MSEGNESDLLRALEDVYWGFRDKDDVFVHVPKVPLLRAGFRTPPFDVKMPDGTVRHIIQQPIGDSLVQQYQPPTPLLRIGPKIKVHTATKLRYASMIRDEISKWPEIEVTSRWPFSHVDGDEPLWPEDCPAHGSIFWSHDEEDVRKADVVLVFGHEDDVLRGALVEAGIGIGLGKRVIVVGINPAYGTWQFHPNVSRVKDMQTARSLLSLLASDLEA